jgi:hypothetical protein
MITFECHGCHSNNAHRSRKRGVFEHLFLPLLLLRPVRCDHCFRRQYVTVLSRVPSRLRQAERSPIATASAP